MGFISREKRDFVSAGAAAGVAAAFAGVAAGADAGWGAGACDEEEIGRASCRERV